MGHCVGDYCDDVLSGRSRIFSLRDAKGEPHVTVEVEHPTYMQTAMLKGIGRSALSNDENQVLAKVLASRDNSLNDIRKALGDEAYDRLITAGQAEMPPRIAQVKGKQDRTPKDEYLPFVQDFVRRPPEDIASWGDVGDLHNTGLRRSRDVWNDLELAKIKAAGKEVSDYVSKADIDAIGSAVWPDTWGKFASGGLVRNATDLHSLVKQLEAR